MRSSASCISRLILVGLLALPALGLLVAPGCGTEEASIFEDGGASSSSSSSGGPGSDGGGIQGNSDGSTNDSGTSGQIGVITVTLRDFQHWIAGDATRNPDFENVPGPPPGEGAGYVGPWTESREDYVLVGFDGTSTTTEAPEYRTSIVKPDLGADGKPVYDDANTFEGTAGRTATTHGKAAFEQWFNDAPGINMKVELPLVLDDLGNGVYSYDSARTGVPREGDGVRQFFPLDGQGFGNTPKTMDPLLANLDHNYHFTMELHTSFTYAGDETFRFTGDDDIFVFINKKIVIDIGGIHGVAQKEVSLPAVAAAIGLEVGKDYALDLFQAERHITGSNVRLDTTIKLRPGTPPS
ncbi:MAG: fibro-slime domain-containing protein [Proteobacteria bacterium]|nr:MAG: fibro-slime domain-containing protein [Pseudomonadota bacterium]